MLLWRVVNNIDATRDIFVSGLMVGIDGTNKNKLDDFHREWPGDVECTPSVIESLKVRNLWTLEDNLSKKYQI
jgi:4-hydroxy-3-polyprenylbenzoate decarboxylase